ncbi:hypothetical protein HJG60_010551 [Phyllostomus discolor]|uniref:Uncharacterized protein n=1 Tax=Phyllostomus discolor TaxID=89673 RepID=A0A834ARI6_9CHIR|nr:hypothetical protein HJG60_010551 [Phyllostomus discolor]
MAWVPIFILPAAPTTSPRDGSRTEVWVKEPKLCFRLPQSALGVLTFFWLPALKCLQQDHRSEGRWRPAAWSHGKAAELRRSHPIGERPTGLQLLSGHNIGTVNVSALVMRPPPRPENWPPDQHKAARRCIVCLLKRQQVPRPHPLPGGGSPRGSGAQKRPREEDQDGEQGGQWKVNQQPGLGLEPAACLGQGAN